MLDVQGMKSRMRCRALQHPTLPHVRQVAQALDSQIPADDAALLLHVHSNQDLTRPRRCAYSPGIHKIATITTCRSDSSYTIAESNLSLSLSSIPFAFAGIQQNLTMASYLQKLRPKSKQMTPQWEPKVAGQPSQPQEAPKVEESTAGPSEPPPAPPAPTVTEPTDEAGVEPVLDDEDQKFLERLAAIAGEPDGPAPPLPTRPAQPTDTIDANGQKQVGRDAQEALMDGADKVALPLSPPETTADHNTKGKGKATDGGLGRKKSVMSYFTIPKFPKKDEKEKDSSKASKDKKKAVITEKDRAQFADDLQSAAQAARNAEPEDARKEDKELTDILDQLNLSAVNNRVFSFSKESEELLNKFTQVLKDLVNGVPTAYNDLEKLFTDYDTQLKKMYGSLPPFVQNLVKSLPAKLTATLGPELLAASAEKPGFDAKQAAGGSKSKRSRIPSVPSLKSLVTAQGAVATALRSIVSFLKLRFPALAMGTNVIMSLAVFGEWYLCTPLLRCVVSDKT
jgi:hypothetical protein